MSIVKIKGKNYKRIPCGVNDFLPYNRDGKPCKDCGAKVGEYHYPYCEAEQCPRVNECEMALKKRECGGQLCGCTYTLTFED
jgi:hypothetical protein